jgi:hypothetical protein
LSTGFSRSFFDCDRGRQTQAGRQIGGDSRSGWNFLIKIGCAGGALESVSIRIILFVCCNPNKPHQGAARRTDRSFYRPFWKRNRTERRHGRSRSLGCAGRMPTRDAALTLRRSCDAENVYGDTQAALRRRLRAGHRQLDSRPPVRVLRMSAIGCRFNRSTQHKR